MVNLFHGQLLNQEFCKDQLFVLFYFFILINKLCDNLISKPTLFVDDTSLFSIAQDATLLAKNLNDDLKIIYKYTFKWKISFNVDRNKQAQEVIFFLGNLINEIPIIKL